MLFRRIAILGVLLAVVAGGVLQIRLMKGAALREIHLLLARQVKLERQIAQQKLELAQFQAPWRVADRLTSMGVDILAPTATRPSAEPKKPASPEAADEPAPPAATEVLTPTSVREAPRSNAHRPTANPRDRRPARGGSRR